MNGNSGARLMYLLTHTPADDRAGRAAAPDLPADLPIQGPAFEMPDTAPSASASARGSVRTWSAPADRSIVRAQPAAQPAAPAQLTTPAGGTHSAEAIARVNAQLETIEPTGAESIGAELASNARKAFILAGRAIFTLQGASSRYTFKINRAEPSDRFPNPAYFVALLTGPDNTADYTYLGILDPVTGQVRTTAKSSYRADSTPVKAFNWCMARVWRDASIEPAKLWHVGRCGRCGRALTVPSSIEMGLGPECAGKLGE